MSRQPPAAASSSSSGWRAVAGAGRAALQWRLLLLWTVCLLLPTVVLAQPMWQLLGEHLDHSAHAASLAQELDLTALSDLIDLARRGSGSPFGNAALLALLMTLLLSPLMTGMVVTAARAAAPLRIRALLAGGLRAYPRMLRMLLWAFIPLGAAFALGAAGMEAAASYGDQAILETDADAMTAAAALLMGLLLMLAQASVDAGRAALAADRRRTSAIKAWCAGCMLLLRRPLAMLGAYLLISAAGLLVAGLLAYGRINLPPVGPIGFAGALLLTQLVVAALAWMRSARLFAMVALARSAP